MPDHDVKPFVRDHTLSLEARGVMSVISLPEFDQTGASVADLLGYGPDGPDVLGSALDELTTAGYVRCDDSGRAVTWRATEKAFGIR